MKREKEVPTELLRWLEQQKQQTDRTHEFNSMNLFCTMPVRAVKMKILETQDKEKFHTVIIPAVDIYTTNKAELKKGFLKRESLAFFISGTKKVFPYGHIYANSGYICLGTIFVPSAIPEKSPAMPIETLFLHNDRNLSHGDSHLFINWEQSIAVNNIIKNANIKLSKLAKVVIEKPKNDIIKNDEIWCLSADVVEQKPLPEALRIMSDIYKVIFAETKSKSDSKESEE